MRIRVTVLLAAVVAMPGLTGQRVDAQEAFFDEGNQRYQEGDFRGALDRYVQILDQGLEGGELYYNV